MPDPLNYEPARSSLPARDHLVSKIRASTLVLVFLTFAMSPLTMAWLRLISSPTAALFMAVAIFLLFALGSAKTAHWVLLLLLQKHPRLPAPFSILPYLAAILFAIVLMVVCLALFLLLGSSYFMR